MTLLDRCRELMEDGTLAESDSERRFVRFYSKSCRGVGLLSILLSDKGNLDKMDVEETKMALFAYALGQQQVIDRKNGIALNNENDITLS